MLGEGFRPICKHCSRIHPLCGTHHAGLAFFDLRLRDADYYRTPNFRHQPAPACCEELRFSWILEKAEILKICHNG
jgi:hypothetical protein